MSSTSKGPLMISALMLYGILPIVALVVYSLIDEYTFRILQGIRSDTFQPSVMNVPNVVTLNHQSVAAEKQSNKRYDGDRPGRTKKTSTVTAHYSDPKVSEQLENSDRWGNIDDYISKLRGQYRKDPKDIHKALRFAEALLNRDFSIHDGGTVQFEAISTFLKAIELIKEKREIMIKNSFDVRKTSDGNLLKIHEEMDLDVESRSIHGLLVLSYINLGRQYYLASMFEKAVEAYSTALELEPNFQDALHFRASSLIILGKYDEAGKDYVAILNLDKDFIEPEIALGISKVLSAKESAIPNGWSMLEKELSHAIPIYTHRLTQLLASDDNVIVRRQKIILLNYLKQLHLAMFTYHDRKSGNTELAWSNLSMANRYKMATLPPYNFSFERQKIDTMRQIFKKGFWPSGVGSDSNNPIFIIGFPRSGSTLLERILDAHPDIVGTGEDSIFNGMLGEIRDGIVQASLSGSVDNVKSTVQKYADGVIEGMKERWLELERNTSREENGPRHPKRFVDKMLTNYLNVGFIHMLFPNALILHICREPMDVLFSTFKHDFPPGSLDYTSSFDSLAQIYRNYRDSMDHWDEQLPGRVIHIRYEDIIDNMPGVVKSLISMIGLEWDESVLSFHKTKYAVNTHSATQVNRPIYADSMQSWRKYEDQLQPLKTLVGETYAYHKFQTNIPGHSTM